MITSGKDGLKEVAHKDGRWNWVLIAPNPETLPLVGGGGGSIDEMRDCLAKQEADSKAENQFANFYGLLRIRFGTGRMGRTKYVFVQASRVDERGEQFQSEGVPRTNTAASLEGSSGKPGGMSAVKHGQAMSQRSAMEKALLEFVHFTAKIEATSLDCLNVEDIIEKVQKVSTADADLLTKESFDVGMEEFRKAHPDTVPAVKQPEASVSNDKALTAACVAEIFEQECAPTAEVQEPKVEVDEAVPMTATEDATRKKLDTGKSFPAAAADRIAESDGNPAAGAEAPAAGAEAPEAAAVLDNPKYKRGDLLFVYSNAAKTWMDDGIVVTVLEEAGDHDGLALPKDSAKVQYNNRRQFKWVTPVQMKMYMKPSLRPVPPPTLLGELLKETHNWISQWHVRYFELSRGYLQWWMSADDAKNGVVPNGSLSLTGLEMSVKETVVFLRTVSSKGMIYAFDATTTESIAKWSEMLRQHQDYCYKMQAYLAERAEADKGEGADKLSGMVQERKRRASLSAIPAPA